MSCRWRGGPAGGEWPPPLLRALLGVVAIVVVLLAILALSGGNNPLRAPGLAAQSATTNDGGDEWVLPTVSDTKAALSPGNLEVTTQSGCLQRVDLREQ